MRNRFHAQQGDGCQRRGDGSNVRLQSERCVLYMIVFCKPWWSCRDVMLLGLKQGWAGLGRAGQGRAGQNRTGQGRAGQNRTGQGRAHRALHTSDPDSVRHHPVMPSTHINIQQNAVTAQPHSEVCLDDSLVVLVELVPATARP